LADQVLLKIVCLLMRWLFGLAVLMFRGDLWGARTRPWGLSWGLSGGSLVLDEETPRVARCLRQRQMSASHSLSGSSPVN